MVGVFLVGDVVDAGAAAVMVSVLVMLDLCLCLFFDFCTDADFYQIFSGISGRFDLTNLIFFLQIVHHIIPIGNR